jgi:hypothetical protein
MFIEVTKKNHLTAQLLPVQELGSKIPYKSLSRRAGEPVLLKKARMLCPDSFSALIKGETNCLWRFYPPMHNYNDRLALNCANKKPNPSTEAQRVFTAAPYNKTGSSRVGQCVNTAVL